MHPYHDYSDCFSVADLFYLEILSAVTETLSENHYDLLMAHINPNEPEWPRKYMDTGRADGFILPTAAHKQNHIQILTEMKAPFIVWGVPRPNMSYCSVTGDNFNGGRLAGEHLVQKGRRRIAFIGGPSYEPEVQKRYEGYAAALKAAGLEVDADLVTYGMFSSSSAAERMGDLLRLRPDLDGVFANSDLMAIAAIKVLQENGRRVPQDVSVVGYDNLSVTEIATPTLTTISQNLPAAGRLLAQNLLSYLQTGVITNVIMPAELVVRSSS
jgi:DNA-binding LacI/PurR family transcriptional regulator